MGASVWMVHVRVDKQSVVHPTPPNHPARLTSVLRRVENGEAFSTRYVQATRCPLCSTQIRHSPTPVGWASAHRRSVAINPLPNETHPRMWTVFIVTGLPLAKAKTHRVHH